MKRLEFKQGKYLFSVLSDDTFPAVHNENGTILNEIAIIGKSNVGKSSLLNHLLTRKKLAKISTRPGKTQTLNFFNIDDQICLVDLPGYGFARVSKNMQSKWSTSIDNYLNQRNQLKLLLSLIDLRHAPTQNDLNFITWANYKKLPLLIIFTKADKLSKNKQVIQRDKNIRDIQEKTGFIPSEYVLYSIKERKNRENLITKINEILKSSCM